MHLMKINKSVFLGVFLGSFVGFLPPFLYLVMIVLHDQHVHFK